jgi:ABC-2 type transport system permease protein
VIARLVARRCVRSGALWGAVFGVYVYASAIGFASSYDTAESRRQFARSFGGNVGLHALFGVPHEIGTVAGFTAWRASGVLPLVGGIWALLLATKLLRGEEESGRSEHLLVGPTTRRGAAGQTLAGIAVGLATLWLVTAVATIGVGRSDRVRFDAGASLFLATAAVAAPAIFAAVGALASQLAATRRQAASLAAGVFGAAYVVRLVADSGHALRWLRWASPLGWVQALRPLTGSDLLPLLPIGGLVVVLSGATLVFAGARDYGGSVLPDRDRRPARTGSLGGPLPLAIRLARGSTVAWAAGLGALGFVVGLVAKTAGEASAESKQFQDIVARLGGHSSGAAAYLGIAFLIVATLLALQAAGFVGATRDEEAQGYLDHLLVRPVGRVQWLAGRVAVAVAGLAAVGVLSGLGAWLGAASQRTGIGIDRLLLAGVNVVPAALFVLGVGTLAHAAAPRLAAGTAYALVAWSFLVQIAGSIVEANRLLLDTSVFHHLAAVPSVDPAWTAVGVLGGGGLAMIGVAIAVFDRRDLAGA